MRQQARSIDAGPGFVRARECPDCGHTTCGESCVCNCDAAHAEVEAAALRVAAKRSSKTLLALTGIVDWIDRHPGDERPPHALMDIARETLAREALAREALNGSFCSQCGGSYVGRYWGWSHCEDHRNYERHNQASCPRCQQVTTPDINGGNYCSFCQAPA